jgi:hypothetical protein
MIRAYDYYGSRDSDPLRVSELISAAADVTFTLRHSSYVGDYYHAKVSQGQELKVQPNEITDEHGPFLRWEEFARYPTVVTVKQVLEAGTEPLTFLDELQQKLRDVDGLEFLRSKRPTRQQ